MLPDINRVIASIAQRYTDPSCPQLNFEDLVAEGNLKLAQLIDKGIVDRSPKTKRPWPNRTEFFAYLKTVVNNHVKGLVHQHCYTIKRTGIKPPPRGVINFNGPTKPIKISLDDPESGLQLGETLDESAGNFRELHGEISEILTPIERLVFDQLVSPNVSALIAAELGAYRGQSFSSVKIRIRYHHMAYGLGISLDQFLAVQADIQKKVKKYMESNRPEDETKYISAINALEEFFSLQIPRSTPQVVVRRLLTLSAHAAVPRVLSSPDIMAHLRLVGAKIPEVREDDSKTLSCFGILYDAKDNPCQICGRRDACRTETCNAGLEDITISPKLLGGKLTKSAQLVDKSIAITHSVSAPTAIAVSDAEGLEDTPYRAVPVSTSTRDEEILFYVNSNFRQRAYNNQIYFSHKDSTPSGKVKYIFWMASDGSEFKFRFCNPSEAIKAKTVRVGNGYYLQNSFSVAQSIELINQHGEESFK